MKEPINNKDLYDCFCKILQTKSYNSITSITNDLCLAMKNTNKFHLYELNYINKKFVENYLLETIIPLTYKIYDLLNSKTEEFVWNDLDNTAVIIPNSSYKVIKITDQNIRFLIIFNNYKFHIRRIWDTFNEEDVHYMEFDGSVHSAISNCSFFEEFSDYNYNKYYKRPSLESFIDSHFSDKIDVACNGFRYQDCRDNGYIVSYSEFMGIDHITMNGLFDSVVFNISNLYEVLLKGDDYDDY